MASSPPRTGLVVATTVAALVAFAANSVLCRVALGGATIDPMAFSVLRVGSGAAMLLLLVALPGRRRAHASTRLALDWPAAAMLALYAVPFSLAYTRLTTGTGALLLFAAVQATMIAGALRLGERPRPLQWTGIALALAGFGVLVAPGVEAPSAAGAFSMAVAGVAWGLYSLRGRRAADALAATAASFTAATPLVVAPALLLLVGAAASSLAGVAVPDLLRIAVSLEGALLAIASGAVASALGYVAWYTALRGLSAGQAAAVQLAVPVLAAAGGIVVLGEALTPRLVVSAVVILGGIALAVLGPTPRGATPPPS